MTTVGVLGAGVMGSGIAQVTAIAGSPTICYDIDAGALTKVARPGGETFAAEQTEASERTGSVGLDLRPEQAGRCAGGLRSGHAALEHSHRNASARQLERGGATDHARADDERTLRCAHASSRNSSFSEPHRKNVQPVDVVIAS